MSATDHGVNYGVPLAAFFSRNYDGIGVQLGYMARHLLRERGEARATCRVFLSGMLGAFEIVVAAPGAKRVTRVIIPREAVDLAAANGPGANDLGATLYDWVRYAIALALPPRVTFRIRTRGPRRLAR